MVSTQQIDIAEPFHASRRWIQVCLAYVGLLTVVDGILATRHSRQWLISDWLINYQAGFIRRGLPGEVAFQLWHLSHISPVFWVVCFYLGCFELFLATFSILALRSTRNFWVLALVVCPATISFHILHPQAGFRKEVIFFAAFGALLVTLQRRKLSAISVATSLTVFMIVGTLSHEALFLYSPYLFAALLVSGRSMKQAIREFSVPFIAGLVTAYLCSRHLGNMQMAGQICSSLGYKMPGPDSHDICGSGAIPYLRYSAETARYMSRTMTTRDHSIWIFPWFALLALLPSLGESGALLRVGLRREVRAVWMSAALSFVMSLVLFRYGTDWGRWIYIHTVSISMLLLFIDGKQRERLLASRDGMGRIQVRSKVFACILLTAYATLWALPNNLDSSSRMGYFGRIIDRMRPPSASSPYELPDPFPLPKQR